MPRARDAMQTGRAPVLGQLLAGGPQWTGLERCDSQPDERSEGVGGGSGAAWKGPLRLGEEAVRLV